MLRVENLNAWYHADKLILENVSFNLANNTVVGLLGSNGAGKTTLINCLSGIHNNILVKSLYFNGELEEFNNREFKKNRHVVFTEDEAFKYWNANEYINYLAYAYNVDIDKEYMHFMLDGFNFEKYINYTIDELSTGNKKKVYLISAFLLRLPLLILDEPLDGLDFSSSEFLYTLINDYRKYGSILMSSHIAESFDITCDEVLYLENGSLTRYELTKGESIRYLIDSWNDE